MVGQHNSGRTLLLRFGLAALSFSMVLSCTKIMREPTNSELAEDFLKTLTVRDSWIYTNHTHPVQKWTNSIRWTVFGEPPDELRSYLQNTLEEYAQFIPIELKQARQGEVSNYLITFLPNVTPELTSQYMRDERNRLQARGVTLHPDISREIIASGYFNSLKTRYEFRTDNPLYRHTYCLFWVTLNPSSSEIASVHVFIGKNFPDLKRCISEETIQALGLRHDTVKSWSSIMSMTANKYRADERISASVYDLLYLRALYDDRIKAGMTSDEARTLAHVVISELRPDEAKKPLIDRLRINFHTAGRLP